MNNNINACLNIEEVYNKLIDVMRIVDPLQKRVIEHMNKEIPVCDIHCFNFWGKNKVCDNCISMRAYNDNTTYVKIEYNKEKTYSITAVPIVFNEKKVVIEILKDITKSLFYESFDGMSTEFTDIHALIDGMNKLVFSDPITDLYNRRYIIEKLPVDIMNAVLLSSELSIIIADIDFFKNVNDRYGHLAGDHTLKKVAEILSDCVNKSNNWVARFGGEEFLVCLPEANLETAKATAEYMRKSLEKSVIQYDGMEFSVTASFGVYNYKSTKRENIDDLIKHADEKLYLAKKNGRNRIEY